MFLRITANIRVVANTLTLVVTRVLVMNAHTAESIVFFEAEALKEVTKPEKT
jgi:hypothetical protein